MYNYNRNSSKPPVPPRRTKRKVKIAPIKSLIASRAATETTNDVTIYRQKCSPPLPPPLSTEKCRRYNFGYLENHQPQCDTAANCPRVESERQHRESRRVIDTASEMIEAKSHDNTTSAGDNSTTSNSANDDPISIASKPPFLSSVDVALSKRKAHDKYPSLFFTLHDFQNVVSDTWNTHDSVDRGDSENLCEEESPKAYTLDNDGDVCFRVTTTNFPFEKCLDRWRDPFDGDFVRNLDDCRFVDSTNKNNRTINDEKSSSCNVFNNNNDSKCRTGTKVRFAIESSNCSPSKHNSNVKIGMPCDSSRSYKSILGDEQAGEQNTASSMKLTEIRGEFADVEDCYDNTRDKSYKSSVEKGNSVMGEGDPFIPAAASKVNAKLKTIPQMYRDNRNNDINCEKIRENSDLISWNTQANNENLKTGKENIITGKTITSEERDAKQMVQGNTSSKVAENVRSCADKSLETACEIEEKARIIQRKMNRGKEMFSNKISDNIREKCIIKNEEMFFDELSQNFVNECNNDESNRNTCTDFTDKLIQIEPTRRLPEENKETNNSFVVFKNNHETVSPSEDIFVKNVPVRVRRNSFLETMLSDDLIDISMNCATISAITSTSIDEELSDSNKLYKIQELETNITTESEHLHDFYNATEMNIKNKKIFNNFKISTQLKNKNASDVKNDVLNELLCNFNNIKLKIVSPKNKKSVTKIEDDENMFSSIQSTVIDNRISKEKDNTSKFEKSRTNNCSVPLNTEAIDKDNVTPIVKDCVKINIEERSEDLKNGITAISEKLVRNKSIEIEKIKELSRDIENEIVKDNSKIQIDKNASNIKLEKISTKTNNEKMSEKTNSIEASQEHKKSRDIRIPKTILKRTSVECERQQTNEFQKRILIGAPATMNKIFDSREFKATRKNGPENGSKCEAASRKNNHTRGEEKTDEVMADDEADDDRRRITNRSALALVEDTMSSGDKCAIARTTISVNPCINNDNNRAVTPVANVSNDQSFRDVVTITPGKVRSFVKYYEIRGDATTVERHSKINNREKVARRKYTKGQAVSVAARNSRPEVITKETKGGDGSVRSNDCDLPRLSSDKTQPSTFVPKVPEEPLSNPICKTEMKSRTKGCERSGSHMSDKETRAPFTKTGAKKSVQFLGDFTVIHSETFDKDECARTVADRDTNTLRKRRGAPGVPPSRDCDDYQKLVRQVAKSEKPPNVGKDSLQSWETVIQIHAVADRTQSSGIIITSF